MNHKQSFWRQLYNNKGFNLVELIIVLSIFVVLVGVSSAFIIEGVRMQDFLSQQSDAVSSADDALTRMTSVIREIADGDDGSYAIDTAEEYTLTFFSDLDADDATEKVTYELNGTQLIESIIEPSGIPVQYNEGDAVETVLANYVLNEEVYGNSIFTYYNGDYPSDLINNPLTDPVDVTDITLIKIYLDVNVNDDRIPVANQVETFIQLRNLKTNL